MIYVQFLVGEAPSISSFYSFSKNPHNSVRPGLCFGDDRRLRQTLEQISNGCVIRVSTKIRKYTQTQHRDFRIGRRIRKGFAKRKIKNGIDGDAVPFVTGEKFRE